MDIKSAALGLIVGAGASLIWCAYESHQVTDAERSWALPGFAYSSYPNDNPSSVYITGTLSGKGVGYPVNTWKITCDEAENICHTASVEEIGPDQLSEIWENDYPIITWTDHTIVAETDPVDKSSCGKATITIDRDTQSVRYVSIPQNQSASYCKIFKNDKINEWVIAAPPKS